MKQWMFNYLPLLTCFHDRLRVIHTPHVYTIRSHVSDFIPLFLYFKKKTCLCLSLFVKLPLYLYVRVHLCVFEKRKYSVIITMETRTEVLSPVFLCLKYKLLLVLPLRFYLPLPLPATQTQNQPVAALDLFSFLSINWRDVSIFHLLFFCSVPTFFFFFCYILRFVWLSGHYTHINTSERKRQRDKCACRTLLLSLFLLLRSFFFYLFIKYTNTVLSYSLRNLYSPRFINSFLLLVLSLISSSATAAAIAIATISSANLLQSFNGMLTFKSFPLQTLFKHICILNYPLTKINCCTTCNKCSVN